MATAPDYGSPLDNPIFAGRALTLPSTSETPRERPKEPHVPPVVAEIIANLGLRYRPSGTADLAAHAAALMLLGQDVADVPPPLLDAAAKKWARQERFMPRASELRDMCRQIQADALRGTDAAGQQLQAHCDALNAKGMDWRWAVVGEPPHRRVERVR